MMPGSPNWMNILGRWGNYLQDSALKILWGAET